MIQSLTRILKLSLFVFLISACGHQKKKSAIQLHVPQHWLVIDLPVEFWKIKETQDYIYTEPKFKFSLPVGSTVSDQANPSPYLGGIRMNFDVKNVNESQDGDGACGSSSSDLSKKQQQLYLTVKTDLDAKNIIGVARAGPSASRLINNNPKVVMAIEDCQGAAEGHELVGGYDANIIFFKGDYKIGFYAMDIKAPPNLKVDQSEEFLKNVKPNGDSITEKSWDGLTDIVRTISYE